MAAEIYENDGAVFAQSTWHGLGKYVGEAMSPTEAMTTAGLDWRVVQAPVYASYNNDTIFDDNYSAVVREDNSSILSILSSEYKPVQNSEVFELAYALNKDVKVESAFSMNNGRKLVVLLKSGSFSSAQGNNDTIDKYLALINSHDGTIALSGLPTSVRIVCSNTLNMALAAQRRTKKTMFRVTHNGDMASKLASMTVALRQYAETAKFFEENVRALSNKSLTSEQIKKFWLDVWGTIEQPVVSNPNTDEDTKNYRNAVAAISQWSNTFDEERKELNLTPNLWVAANAATKWLQHKDPARGRKPTVESRTYNNLLGKQQEMSIDIMNMALALA